MGLDKPTSIEELIDKAKEENRALWERGTAAYKVTCSLWSPLI